MNSNFFVILYIIFYFIFQYDIILVSLTGLTPVHLATKEGSVDVLKFLFQMGANKNCAVSHYPYNYYYYMYMYLYLSIIYNLFLYYQDSCSGRTPLHYAVESQNFQMCNFLLENGCNVNAITFSGMLQYCIIHN